MNWFQNKIVLTNLECQEKTYGMYQTKNNKTYKFNLKIYMTVMNKVWNHIILKIFIDLYLYKTFFIFFHEIY